MKISLENFRFFNIFAQNIHCGYRLEPPRQGSSNKYPQCIFGSKIRNLSIPLQTPSFSWGVRGYTFQGHVFLIISSV